MLDRTSACEALREVVCELGLESRLIKFDVLAKGAEWVVLDIGLDSPARILADYESRSLDFYSFYFDLFLGAGNGETV